MKTSVRIISVILSVILLFGILPISSFAEENVTGSNWMSALSSDLKISEISIPGTHDSATQFVFGSPVARCQSLSISAQLYAGVRYLDIRLEKHDNGYNLVHSFADSKMGLGFLSPDLQIETVLDDCYKFLEANPGETVIFCVKEDDGDANDEFIDSFYEDYISVDAEKWYTQNANPTLGEVRGKLIFARRNSTSLDAKTTGIDLTGWRDQGDEQTVPDRFPISESEYANIQDRYELNAKTKWNDAVKPMLEADLNPDDLNINFFSTAKGYIPILNAKYINAYFNKYEMKKSYVGIVLFDFANSSLCEKIYSLNSFSQTAKEAASAPEDHIKYGLFPFTYSIVYFMMDSISEFAANIAVALNL